MLVAVTGLVCTLAAWRFVADVVRTQHETRFSQTVRASTEAIHDRMDTYASILRSARGLVQDLGMEPHPGRFRTFVESLELPRYYPGIQGLGWTRRLPPAEVPAHEAARRRLGAVGFRVWPQGPRGVYTSIDLLEPLDWRNARAIGYDMFSEPTRRAAMQRAEDTGEVAATGKVELVQEAGEVRQPGFLMYLPVYDGPAATTGARRERLRGWVYAPFRSGDLFRGALSTEAEPEIELRVYDGVAPRPEALLFETGRDGRDERVAQERLTIGGRAWTLRFAATGAFVRPGERILPVSVLALGLSLTILLFFVTRQEVAARRRAERAALRATFLAEAGRILASSLDHARTLRQVAEATAAHRVDGCIVLAMESSGPLWIVAHRDAALARRAEHALRTVDALQAARAIGADRALRARATQVRSRIAPESVPALSHVPGLADVVRAAAIRTAVTVPLLARGEAVGTITLLSEQARPFAAEDVALAEDLARLAAAAVDTSHHYARAQRAVQERDEFLSIASHELKTPLTSLVLQSDSLRAAARRADAATLQGKAEVIRRNVDRLARLVASLLDLSRISAGRLELELEPVDLGALAREVAGRFEEEARRSGCALEVDMDEGVVGRWDALRLDQVVTNLLSNAVKYGPGKPVELRVGADGPRAWVQVRDHGIGISEADQRRIFGRFERAVSKRNYGGFGLGLWIVRQIVEALGGSVSVESVPGEGSTFTVELDRGLEAAEAAAPLEDRGAPGA